MLEPEYIEESVKINCSESDVINFLKDPSNIKLWSSQIREIIIGIDGIHTGNSAFGPVQFKWRVDEEKGKITMTHLFMGYEVNTYFYVEGDEKEAIVTAKWPLEPYVDDYVVDTLKEKGKEELLQLKRILENQK